MNAGDADSRSGSSGTDPRVAALTTALRRSRKYATLHGGLLERTARWALQRHPTLKAASRAARSKLHQAFGAYFTSRDLAAVEMAVAELAESDVLPAEALRVTSRRVLSRHASTRERLDFISELYPRLLGSTAERARIRRVIDLACGLHPFALPWMGLRPETEYDAYEIDHRLVAAIQAFMRAAGQSGSARACDLLGDPLPSSQRRADAVFLLKTLPFLEHQERGGALRLLRSLDTPLLIVSYPARSLGGRQKGMRSHYRAQLAPLAEALGAAAEEIAFPTETFYLLRR